MKLMTNHTRYWKYITRRTEHFILLILVPFFTGSTFKLKQLGDISSSTSDSYADRLC